MSRLVYLFYIFSFFLLQPSALFAKPITQQLFEGKKRLVCPDASLEELKSLSCRYASPTRNVMSIDQTVESIVFQEIAKCEKAKLECAEIEMRRTAKDPELRKKSLQIACDQLGSLKQALSNEKFFRKKVEEYKDLTNGMMHPLDKEEAKVDNGILDLLKRMRTLNLEKLATIRSYSPLLGFDSFYELASENLSESLLSNGKSEQETCALLEKKYDSLMAQGALEIKEAIGVFDEQMKKPDGLDDPDFREYLWKSSCRNSVLSGSDAPLDISNGTFCRFESRFGEGVEIKSRMTLLLTLATVPPALKVLNGGTAKLTQYLGKAAAATSNVEKLAALSKWIKVSNIFTRTVGVAEFTAWTAVSIDQIQSACKPQIGLSSNQKTCKATSDQEFREISLANWGKDSCLLAGVSGAIFTGIGGLAVKRAFALSSNKKLLAEIETRIQGMKSTEAKPAASFATEGPAVNPISKTTSIKSGDYTPIRHPEYVMGSHVAASETAEVQTLKNLGVLTKERKISTYLEGITRHRLTKVVDDISPPSSDDRRLSTYIQPSIYGEPSSKLGKIIEISGFPPGYQFHHASRNTLALKHPDMKTGLKELEDMGYTLTVDTSLSSTEAGAYFSPTDKIIAIRSNSSWQTFQHEFQHAQYNHFVIPHFESLQANVIAGNKLADLLPAETVAAYGKNDVLKLEKLMRKQIPSNAANETMSVERELKELGWYQYMPGRGSHRERYNLKYQIRELTEIAEKNPAALTDIQRKTLKEAIRRHDVTLPARDFVVGNAGYAAVGGFTVTVFANQTTAPNQTTSSASFPKLFYDQSGNLIGVDKDGKLHGLRPVEKKKKRSVPLVR